LITYAGVDEKSIYGIDIGTGASCIYPLIGVKKNENWGFFASDVDNESCKHALENIARNQLQSRIIVVHNPDNKTILSVIFDNPKAKDIAFAFCMTNPPFYDGPGDLASSRQLKGDDTYCPIDGPSEYTDSEYFFQGGEAGFIKIMIEESLRYRDRCLWYSAMISKKANLKPLLKVLRSHAPDIKTVHSERFIQGSTSRWFIAWSFSKIALPPKPKKAKVVTSRALRFRIPEGSAVETIVSNIVKECDEVLKIIVVVAADDGVGKYECKNTHNRWSRKSRRGGDAEECPFDFAITAEKDAIEFSSSSLSPHFESLASHLQKKHNLRK
jgi:23S rRNA A1618 N6-methylase RlmF